MKFIYPHILKSFVLFLSIASFISCNKDSENNNSNHLKDIACKYSLEYSNSDSTIFNTLYVEYYDPQKSKNVFDTIISDDEWVSPTLIFNSEDALYFKAIVKTTSYNTRMTTKMKQKFAPNDEQKIEISFNNYNNKTDSDILILDREIIITDTHTLSGTLNFSKK